MSDTSFTTPRPVGLATIIGVFILFAAFLLVIRYTYLRHPAAEAYNLAPEKLSKDQEWQATPESRLQYLHELREKHNQELGSYGWTDRKAGVVQIPIDRAMDLIVQQYSGSKSSK